MKKTSPKTKAKRKLKPLPSLTLKGSCQCGKVSFQVKSNGFYPYQLCYCSICRKTQGGGGFAINLSADHRTLKLKGHEHIATHHARVKNPEDKRAHVSSGQRKFCRHCGTFLWVYDSDWPDLMHPFSSVIDTPLPKVPQKTHIMLEFKAPWVTPDFGPKDKKHQRYPKESIAQWHERVIARRHGTKDEASQSE